MNITSTNYSNSYSQPNYIGFKALPKKYTKVDDYLIRGPHPSIKNLIQLKKEGVNQIYDFRHYSNFGMKFIERFAAKLLGIKYIRDAYSHLHDQYPTLEHFERVAQDVKANGEKGGKTLFHCNSGRHRTAQMAAFYDLTKGEPLEKIKEAHKEDYNEIVDNIIQKQLIDRNYFNRKRKDTTEGNFIRKRRNSFNNQLVNCTRTAFDKFVELLKNNK
ncbi:MAG: tyrosine-protein phosphatase [Candidatus Gastranaerophilales bacterium]|nr:tyrosine-protein phosphatase [Candidatus Gastranaerophilales bacterium]